MKKTLIKNATLVNEGTIRTTDILIEGGYIGRIAPNIAAVGDIALTIDAEGLHLLPGVIDTQVHFRQPGLVQHGSFYTESKAAIAGGVTSVIDMPDTLPPTTSTDLAEQKMATAQVTSLANFSCYVGANNENIIQLLNNDLTDIAGIVLMEQLTRPAYEYLFGQAGDAIIVADSRLINISDINDLIQKYGRRLHLVNVKRGDLPQEKHQFLSTAASVASLCLNKEHLQSEHLTPSLPDPHQQSQLWNALFVEPDGIDMVASEHAPYSTDTYTALPQNGKRHSVGFVQHLLPLMLRQAQQSSSSLTQLVQKLCHAPAQHFGIRQRGFVREGFYADLVLVDLQKPFEINHKNMYSKSKYSPLLGEILPASITHTFVNGHLVFWDGVFDECMNGHRLRFFRNS